MRWNAGHWNTQHFVQVEKARVEAERRQARLRREHRALDRRARLLRNLNEVDTRLRKALAERPFNRARAENLLKRHNRLVDALNEFVGTSQKVDTERLEA